MSRTVKFLLIWGLSLHVVDSALSQDTEMQLECETMECAILTGTVAVVRELLKEGADPNVLIRRSSTQDTESAFAKYPSLMVAVDQGHEEISILLMRAGAVTHGGDTKHTALTAAAMKNQIEVVKYILENDLEDPNRDATEQKPFNALGYAVALGHHDLAQLLLESGADPNYVSLRNGVSVLQEAIGARNIEMIQLLLDAGVYLTPCNRSADW